VDVKTYFEALELSIDDVGETQLWKI
jgi:hypothetical protein